MLTHPTCDRLEAIGLSGMAQALHEQRRAGAMFESLSFEERLGLLVDREAAERDAKRLATRLRFAALRHTACVEDIDMRSPRGIDAAVMAYGVQTTQVLIAGSKRVLTPALRKPLRRRSAIEPEFGHMKTDGRLARCPLKGLRGDAMCAVLCGCGHNLRKILNHIRKLFAVLLAMIVSALSATVASRTENNLSSQRAAA